ncbi:hypothetical protein Trydic_g10516 [Trypoxylus dichotomus]
MVFYCCVPYCKNTSKEFVMRILPVEPDRFEMWSRLIHRPDIKYEKRSSYRICDAHFSNEMKFIANRNRSNLVRESVPNRMLPEGDTVSGDSDQPPSSGFQLKQGQLSTS